MNSTRPLIFLHYLVRVNNADAGRPWNSTAWDVCRAVRVDCSLSFTVPLLACWGNLVLRRWSPRHQEDKMKMLNLISSETTIKATLTAKEAKWQRREVKREKSVFALVYISKKMIAEERIRYVTPGSHELPPPFRSLREVHKGFRKSITNWLSKCGYNASRHSFAWKRKLFFCIFSTRSFERAIKGSSRATNKYLKRMGSRPWSKALSRQSECRCERHTPGG